MWPSFLKGQACRFLHERDEYVKLAGGDEGIYRVGEDDDFRLGDGLYGWSEILLQGFDLLPGIKYIVPVSVKLFLKV